MEKLKKMREIFKNNNFWNRKSLLFICVLEAWKKQQSNDVIFRKAQVVSFVRRNLNSQRSN